MNRSQTLQSLLQCGLVPVIRARSRSQAEAIAAALLAADVPVLEITCTVPGAIECIAALAAQHGERALIGAGTVLDAATARRAIQAGARFIVSPHLDPAIIAAAHAENCPAIPGALTPTEVVQAMAAGADLIKIFPCDALGGPAYIKALLAPLPQARLFPTGGVTLATAAAYLEAGAVALGAGSALLNPEHVRQENWPALQAVARKFLAILAAHRAKTASEHA